MAFLTATQAAASANARIAANRVTETLTYSKAAPKYGFWIGFQDYITYRKTNPAGGTIQPGPGTDFNALLTGVAGTGTSGLGGFTGVGDGANAGVAVGAKGNNGAVFLPLPTTMVDRQEVKYNEYGFGAKLGSALSDIGGHTTASVAETILAAGGDIILHGAGFELGVAAQQFYTVLLEGPTYKAYGLTFFLPPHSPADSENYVKIFNRLRKAAAPEPDSGIFWRFPEVVQGLYVPQGDALDTKAYRFKPAVLTQVAVNYAPANVPAFYNNMAPESVVLSLGFLEIEYWIRSNFE